MGNTYVLADSIPLPLPPAPGTVLALIISIVIVALIWWRVAKRHAGRLTMVWAVVVGIVVYLGVAGPLAAVWPFALLRQFLTNLVSAGVTSAGGGSNVYLALYLLVAVGLAGWSAAHFLTHRTIGSLVILFLLALPLMAFQDFQGISAAYVNLVDVFAERVYTAGHVLIHGS